MTRIRSARRRAAGTLTIAAVSVGAVACGGSGAPRAARPVTHAAAATVPLPSRSAAHQHHRSAAPAPLALVTAPSENRLFEITVPGARVIRSIALPGEPEYAATDGVGGLTIVVSAGSGTVTILSGPRMRTVRVLGGFVAPHIPALVPGGGYVYVTDDGSGLLTAILLRDLRIVSRTFVGIGAHHLAVSPDASRVWVALGQSAHTLAILGTRTPPPKGITGGRWFDPGHPHVLTRFSPGYRVHDLLFAPDGRQVWVTSASGPTIGVFGASDHRLRFRVPVGPPPQHVAFQGAFAYVTSGYGSLIERVNWRTGAVLRRVRAPYGSFELDTSGHLVVVASLLTGTVASYDLNLSRIRVRRLASSTEDVALLAR